MPDLTSIYNAFWGDEPLPPDDDPRYVDLSAVRGENKIARRLVQRIINATKLKKPSHHLVMGHTKCGKTTELNRVAYSLRKEGYQVVFFDVAEMAGSREFEYTTVLLLMAGQVVAQLSTDDIFVEGASQENLAEFLRSRDLTLSKQVSSDATVKTEAKTGFFTRWIADFGIGGELRGGFERSREITVKIEADTRGFISAIRNLIMDACQKVSDAKRQGLVIISDGCDKLAISATDENNKSRDLQSEMFVNHAPDLQAIPCHVIYTVPISIPVNLGDIWQQTPEFVPAIPVNKILGIDEKFMTEGRAKLLEVVTKRLTQCDTRVEDLFVDENLLIRLIEASGGHISDLLLFVREAVLEAQALEENKISESHVNRVLLSSAQGYTRLIESKYLPSLVKIDENKTAELNSDNYRELIFKRLALEYVCGNQNYVDLHPLVAASDTYRRLRSPNNP